MSRTMPAGQAFTCFAYLDVQSFAAVEETGRDLGTVNADIVASLRTLGVAANNFTEATRNRLVADSLNITCNLTPSRPVTVDMLDTAILNGANANLGTGAAERLRNAVSNPRAVFSAHTTRGSVGGLLTTLFTLGTNGSNLVVDEDTIRPGTNDMPPPTSASALSRAVQGVTGAQVASTNPNRDGQNPNQANMPIIPWYVYLAIVAGSVVGLGVLAGYTWRSFK